MSVRLEDVNPEREQMGALESFAIDILLFIFKNPWEAVALFSILMLPLTLVAAYASWNVRALHACLWVFELATCECEI